MPQPQTTQQPPRVPINIKYFKESEGFPQLPGRAGPPGDVANKDVLYCRPRSTTLCRPPHSADHRILPSRYADNHGSISLSQQTKEPSANMPTELNPHRRRTLHGIEWGILSVLFYSCTLVCLRYVAEDHDPMWITAVRAVPIAVISWFLVLRRARQGRPAFPPAKTMGVLILAAVFVQFAGNLCMQWGLGQIGLSMCVPLMFSSMILGGALLGWVVLGEVNTKRTYVAFSFVIGAISCVGLASSHAADPENVVSTSERLLGLGVAASVVAGLGYAIINTVIRTYGTKHGVPVPTMLLVIGTSGVVTFGTLSGLRLGIDNLLNISRQDYLVMFVGGGFNAAAFYALSKGLQMISVAHMNALNSAQNVILSLIGIFFFGETFNAWLVVGIVLLVIGLPLIEPPKTTAISKA